MAKRKLPQKSFKRWGSKINTSVFFDSSGAVFVSLGRESSGAMRDICLQIGGAALPRIRYVFQLNTPDAQLMVNVTKHCANVKIRYKRPYVYTKYIFLYFLFILSSKIRKIKTSGNYFSYIYYSLS
jgi:hypothetical protein